MHLLCLLLLSANKDSIQLSWVDLFYFKDNLYIYNNEYCLSSMKTSVQVRVSRQLESFSYRVLLSHIADSLMELIYSHAVAIFGDESWFC